jgi:hypothetical protein
MTRRLSQNFRENLGYAKRTTNEHLEREFVRLQGHTHALKTMRAALYQYVSSIKSFHSSAGTLAKVFREPPLINAGVKRPTDSISAAMDDYHTKFSGISDNLAPRFEEHIIGKIDGLLVEIAGVEKVKSEVGSSQGVYGQLGEGAGRIRRSAGR